MTVRILLILLIAAAPVRVAAQGPSLLHTAHAPEPRDRISTGAGFAVVGGIAALALVDRPIGRFLQRHRSHTIDEVSEQFRRMGTAWAYGGIALGLTGVGLVSGDEDVKRAGGRLIFSEVVAIASDLVIKKLVGRVRPDEADSPLEFHPLRKGAVSFVSGHTTMAFTLATGLSDDLHSTPASILLYTIAAGTAWSRLNDERHWFSDVAGGAMLGITIAKVVDNRWEILGIDPPHFLTEPPDPAP